MASNFHDLRTLVRESSVDSDAPASFSKLPSVVKTPGERIRQLKAHSSSRRYMASSNIVSQLIQSPEPEPSTPPSLALVRDLQRASSPKIEPLTGHVVDATRAELREQTRIRHPEDEQVMQERLVAASVVPESSFDSFPSIRPVKRTGKTSGVSLPSVGGQTAESSAESSPKSPSPTRRASSKNFISAAAERRSQQRGGATASPQSSFGYAGALNSPRGGDGASPDLSGISNAATAAAAAAAAAMASEASSDLEFQVNDAGADEDINDVLRELRSHTDRPDFAATIGSEDSGTTGGGLRTPKDAVMSGGRDRRGSTMNPQVHAMPRQFPQNAPTLGTRDSSTDLLPEDRAAFYAGIKQLGEKRNSAAGGLDATGSMGTARERSASIAMPSSRGRNNDSGASGATNKHLTRTQEMAQGGQSARGQPGSARMQPGTARGTPRSGPLRKSARPKSGGRRASVARKNNAAEVNRSMATYVPRLVLQRFVSDPKTIKKPEVYRFGASILFADISGYSSLAEKCSQMGPSGIEELSTSLNEYFGRLVRLIINEHGGDVINFAGDALIVLFANDSAMSGPSNSLSATASSKLTNTHSIGSFGSSRSGSVDDLSSRSGTLSSLPFRASLVSLTYQAESLKRQRGADGSNSPKIAVESIPEDGVAPATSGAAAAGGSSFKKKGRAGRLVRAGSRRNLGKSKVGVKAGGPSPGMSSVREQAEERNLRHATTRAVKCALDIQDKVPEHKAAGVKMTLHIGVSAGVVQCMHVGGVQNSWQYLLMGEPFAQLDSAVSISKPGQVVVSKGAWPYARQACKGQVLPGEDYLVTELSDQSFQPVVPPPIKVDETLATCFRPYIPMAVQDRLRQGFTEFAAELRRVTVIFTSLPGLSAMGGNGPDTEKVQRTLKSVQQILFQTGGMIRQFLVEDKGATLIACYGIPPFTHKDDPVRATRAAMTMKSVLDELGLEPAIGVTTGHCFCGSLGLPGLREEYAMVGDTVNLSARLMKASPDHDGLLMDEATYELASAQVSFESRHSIFVKGKLFPVNIYRPIPDMGGSEHQVNATLYGRVNERKILRNELKGLTDGINVRVVVLEGDQGMGKTSLARNLGKLAPAKVTALFASPVNKDIVEISLSDKKKALYTGFRGIMRQLLGKDNTSARESLMQRVKSDPVKRWVSLVPLINHCIPLNIPATKASQKVSDRELPSVLGDLLLFLLRKESEEHPTMIVIDDAHQLDRLSWELMLSLSRRLTHLLLVVALRPMDSPPLHLQQLLRTPSAQHIVLRKLTKDEAIDFASKALGVKSLPAQATDFVLSKGRGNPASILRAIEPLRDTNFTQDEMEHMNLSATPDQYNPERIIIGRMAQLPLHHQMLLKVASVIADEFDAETLKAVFPSTIKIKGTRLEDLIVELTELKYLVAVQTRRGKGMVTRYRINNMLVDIAYNQMLFSQRQELHRAMALHIEERYKDDLSKHFPTLVHHFSRAIVDAQSASDPAMVERAEGYALELVKVKQAERVMAEAVYYLQRAMGFIAFLPDSQSRFANEQRLRRMQKTLYDKMENLNDEGIEAAKTEDELRDIFQAMWVRANRQRNVKDASDICQRLKVISEKEFFPADLTLQVLHAFWTVEFFSGHFVASNRYCEEGVAAYKATVHDKHIVSFGGLNPLLSCITFAALNAWFIGNHDYGAQKLNQVKLLPRTSTVDRSLIALTHSLLYTMLRRSYRAVVAEARRLLSMDWSSEVEAWAAQIRIMLAVAESYESGDVLEGDVMEEIEDSLEVLRSQGRRWYLPIYMCIVVELFLEKGLHSDGALLLSDATDASKETGCALMDAELHRLMGHVVLAKMVEEGGSIAAPDAPELGLAEKHFMAAIHMARQQGANSLMLRATMSYATVLVRSKKDKATARRLVSDALELIKGGSDSADVIEARVLLKQISVS